MDPSKSPRYGHPGRPVTTNNNTSRPALIPPRPSSYTQPFAQFQRKPATPMHSSTLPIRLPPISSNSRSNSSLAATTATYGNKSSHTMLRPPPSIPQRRQSEPQTSTARPTTPPAMTTASTSTQNTPASVSSYSTTTNLSSTARTNSDEYSSIGAPRQKKRSRSRSRDELAPVIRDIRQKQSHEPRMKGRQTNSSSIRNSREHVPITTKPTAVGRREGQRDPFQPGNLFEGDDEQLLEEAKLRRSKQSRKALKSTVTDVDSATNEKELPARAQHERMHIAPLEFDKSLTESQKEVALFLCSLGFHHISSVIDVLDRHDGDLSAMIAQLSSQHFLTCSTQDSLLKLGAMGFFNWREYFYTLLDCQGDLSKTAARLQDERLIRMSTIPMTGHFHRPDSYSLLSDQPGLLDNGVYASVLEVTRWNSIRFIENGQEDFETREIVKTDVQKLLKKFSRSEYTTLNIPRVPVLEKSAFGKDLITAVSADRMPRWVWSSSNFLGSVNSGAKMQFWFGNEKKQFLSHEIQRRLRDDYSSWTEHRFMLEKYPGLSSHNDFFQKEVDYIRSFINDLGPAVNFETHLILGIADVIGRVPSVVLSQWAKYNRKPQLSDPESDELRILLEEFVFIFNKLVLSGKIDHFRQIETGDCNLQRVIEMGVFDDGIDNFNLARNMQSIMIKSLDSPSECSKLRYWLGREHMSFPKSRRKNWVVAEEDRDEYIQDWIEISSNKYHDSTQELRFIGAEFAISCSEITCALGCGSDCPCVKSSRHRYTNGLLNHVPDRELSNVDERGIDEAVYECHDGCFCTSAQDSCKHRLVQFSPENPDIQFELFRTRRAGWAVRTKTDIPFPGTYIGEYLGEYISEETASHRANMMKMTEVNNYLWTQYEGHTTIDAGTYGNITRFFNHSCDPNCEAYQVRIGCVDDRAIRVAFFSKNAINAGEELTFNYNFRLVSKMKKGVFKCACSSKCKAMFEQYEFD